MASTTSYKLLGQIPEDSTYNGGVAVHAPSKANQCTISAYHIHQKQRRPCTSQAHSVGPTHVPMGGGVGGAGAGGVGVELHLHTFTLAGKP